jgi:hypothetical protein
MAKLAFAVVGLALGAALALPGAAGASHDPSGAPFGEDFVTGRVFTSDPPGIAIAIHTVFNARSGPSGESPTGTVRIDVELLEPGNFLTFDTARVTCLNVTDNRATIGTQSQFGFGVLHFVEDNDGAGQDRHAVLLPGEVPTVCPANPSADPAPIFGGDITVHDAVPFPTSKDQCKNGGWREFPGFKNQGQCVAFVERGRAPQEANGVG